MNTYLIYTLDDTYLGEVQAASREAAVLLAGAVFPAPHRVLSFRLTYARRLAA